MRFATVVVSGLFAVLASAQTTTAPPTTLVSAPATAVSLSPAQQSQKSCMDACKAGDVNCQAHCVAVPSPDASQVNATNACVAKCPQGDGSAAETDKYKDCVNGCIADNYYSTSKGTPEATGVSGSGSGSGSDSGSGASPTGSSGSGSGSGSGSDSGSGASPSGTGTSGSTNGTATGSSAAATSSKAGAASVIVGSGATLVGLFVAVLAL